MRVRLTGNVVRFGDATYDVRTATCDAIGVAVLRELTLGRDCGPQLAPPPDAELELSVADAIQIQNGTHTLDIERPVAEAAPKMLGAVLARILNFGPGPDQEDEMVVAEIDGKPAVVLSDRQWKDMFWASYIPHALDGLIRPESWWFETELDFHTARTGEICAAFAGKLEDDGRIRIRLV